jgi:putative ABC transport system permease protein
MSVMQDLRYATRTLAKSPGYTTVAVLTLALGIGANTAMFSVLYGVLLRPLPYPQADRIVALSETNRSGVRIQVSRLDLFDWRAQSKSFEAIAPYSAGDITMVGGNEPQQVSGAGIGDGFFRVFGTVPLRGRLPDLRNDAAPSEAVISESLWRTAFGGSDDVIGRKLQAAGNVYEIVAVIPQRYAFPAGAQLWIPLDLLHDESSRSAHNYRVVAKLRPGVDLASAQTELGGIASRLGQQYPTSNGNIGARVLRLQGALTASARPTLLLLLGMVAIVLLIACANVANLMLVRTSGRGREMAIRSALGAGAGRIVRQLLVESLTLAVIGGAAGLLVASYLPRAMNAWLEKLPSTADVGLNGPVLAFAALLSIAAGLVFGLMPALHAVRGDLMAFLRSGQMRFPGSERVRGGFIVAEVAFCCVLLAAAALTARTILRLQDQSLGFDPQHVIVVSAPLAKASNDAESGARAARLLDSVRAIPGVESAGATNDVPMSGGGSNGGFMIEGRASADERDWSWAQWRIVDEGYFSTMRIPVVRGRAFTRADSSSTQVAIINQAAAQKFWPGEDPVGKRIAIPGIDMETYKAFRSGKQLWFTVIGVVGNVRDEEIASPADPQLYVLEYQHPAWDLQLVVRSPLPLGALEQPIKSAVRAADPNAPVGFTTADAVLRDSIATPRLRSVLIGLFAAVALLLAIVGVYGVVSYSVEQRIPEIGLRVALGADRRDLVLMVLGRGMKLILIGFVIGCGLVIALKRVFAGFVYGVTATDPLTLVAVGGLLALATLVASYAPARRATRVDPIQALRQE